MFEILRIAAVETEDQVIQDSLLLESDGLVNFRFVLHNSGEGTSQECVDWDSF